jgi:hypothetical protein
MKLKEEDAMKEKAVPTAAPTLADSLTSPPQEQDAGDTASAKKAALERKCQDLLSSLASYQTLYDDILASLAESHQQTLTSLQDELIQLKERIPGLEKKSIKRLKLAGTLTSLDKESQKIKLKASQKRKKDLHRMDEFGLVSLRTLRALNRKIAER